MKTIHPLCAALLLWSVLAFAVFRGCEKQNNGKTIELDSGTNSRAVGWGGLITPDCRGDSKRRRDAPIEGQTQCTGELWLVPADKKRDGNFLL